MELIVTTQESLEEIVKNAVQQAISVLTPRKEETKALMEIPEALLFLNEQGIRIGKSQFYKYTMRKEIAAQAFGKKLLFKKEDLIAWAESRLKSNRSNDVAKAVAESINKKNRK